MERRVLLGPVLSPYGPEPEPELILRRSPLRPRSRKTSTRLPDPGHRVLIGSQEAIKVGSLGLRQTALGTCTGGMRVCSASARTCQMRSLGEGGWNAERTSCSHKF